MNNCYCSYLNVYNEIKSNIFPDLKEISRLIYLEEPSIESFSISRQFEFHKCLKHMIEEIYDLGTSFSCK